MSQEESWSPDEGSGTEVFDQGDEALDEQSRTDPEFVERLEQDPRWTPRSWSTSGKSRRRARSSTTLRSLATLREGPMTRRFRRAAVRSRLRPRTRTLDP